MINDRPFIVSAQRISYSTFWHLPAFVCLFAIDFRMLCAIVPVDNEWIMRRGWVIGAENDICNFTSDLFCIPAAEPSSLQYSLRISIYRIRFNAINQTRWATLESIALFVFSHPPFDS